MTTHNVRLEYRRPPYARWYWFARCACGWASAPGSKEDADAAMSAHVASSATGEQVTQ